MAIRINKPVEIMNMPEVYCRLRVWFNERGDKLDVWMLSYPSKEAYKADARNSFYLPGVDGKYQFDYDRERDGSDILLFCHEKIVEILTTDVTEEREVTTIDEKGEEKKEVQTVVIKQKFCEPEEIVIQLDSITKDFK